MMLTNPGDHLADAFSDLLVKKEDIQVACAFGAEVCLNRNLICLFSPFFREMLAGIPNSSSAALIIPDASAFAMEQVGKIFNSGVTDVGISSYKDIKEIVDTGKLFKLDLSQLIFEKTDEARRKVPVDDVSEDTGSKHVDTKMNMRDTDQEFIPEDFAPSFPDIVNSSELNPRLCVKNPDTLLKSQTNPHNCDLDTVSDQEFFVNECPTFIDDQVPRDTSMLSTLSSSKQPLATEVHRGPSNAGHHNQSLSQSIANLSPSDNYERFLESNRSEGDMQISKTRISCSNCKVFAHVRVDKLKIHYFKCKKLNPYARKLMCRFCPLFKCKNPSTFHKHMRRLHLNLLFPCGHCEFTTFYQGELIKHITKYHKTPNDQPLHEDIETGENFSCNRCDYVGTTRRDLNIHKRFGHKSTLHSKLEHSHKSVTSWRKEIGWGHDDQYTCDYWNFVGKGRCRMEDGHKDDWKVSRHHVCALCFRNTGQKENHPATFCQLFPLPEREKRVGSHKEWEKGPSMAEMGLARCEERKENANSSEEIISTGEGHAVGTV